MRLKEYLVSRIPSIFGFSSISKYVFAFLSIGYPSGEAMPKVLLDFNVLNMVRGLFTRFVVSTNLDWIWPFWIERQFHARCKDFSVTGFNPASINSTNRNWTGIGALNCQHESIVDPRGLLTPYYNSWSLDCWIQHGGKVYSPAKQDSIKKQSLHHNLPMVVTEFVVDNKISVTMQAFTAENVLGESYAIQKVVVKNVSKKRVEDHFAFAFRPYNPEGISLIEKIEFRETGEVFINNRLSAVLMQIPNGINTSSLSKGDVHHFFDEGKNCRIFDSRSSRVGMASGITIYKFDLAAGQSTEYEIRMPNDGDLVKKLKPNRKITREFYEKIRREDYAVILQREVEQWESKLTKGMQIKLPEKKVEAAYDANKAFMLMFYDRDSITPGPSTYHAFWFRDAAYLINGLDKLGYHEETENILQTYRKRIHASGFFYSQAGEWDSNGQAIWTLVEHYRLTGNKQFLKENLPIIRRGANWILRKMATNFKADPGYKGLIPPGLSAEHFGLNDYYYWDDYWCLTGLRDAAFASGLFNKNNNNYLKGFQKLNQSIDTSLKYVEARLGTQIIPISPSRRMDSAAVGCLASYYPCRIYEPTDIRLVNTVNHLFENNFIDGGFFHDVNHSGYGTYLTMHHAQCFIGQRDQRAVGILDWVLSVASATYTWPEAIHPRTFGGCIGDGHHGWAAADFTLLVRNMLFIEEGDNLVITPVVPPRWLKVGDKIELKQAKSYFGTLNYSIEVISAKEIKLSIDAKFDKEPKKIIWQLPFAISNVKLKGKKVQALPAGSNCLELSARTKEVVVQK